MNKSRAETIKAYFKYNVPNVVTLHWNQKLLPGLDVRSQLKFLKATGNNFLLYQNWRVPLANTKKKL